MDFQTFGDTKGLDGKNNKISVIVPIYNMEGLLNRCVESIVNQSYRNIEIIMVDDGSTDQSLSLCEEWEKKDSRIIVIHKENGGLSDARNAGLNAATGDFISFVDPDDYVEPSFLETMWKKLESSDAEIVECAISNELTDGQIRIFPLMDTVRNKQDATEHLLKNDDLVFSFAWNKLYRMSLIAGIRFDVNLRQSEDTPFVFEAIQNCRHYSQVSAPLYHYIMREGSIVSSGFSLSKISDITAARQILELCKKCFPQYVLFARTNVSMRGYYLLRQLLCIPNWSEKYGEFYKEIRSAMAESSIKEIRKVQGFRRSVVFWLSEKIQFIYSLYLKLKKE